MNVQLVLVPKIFQVAIWKSHLVALSVRLNYSVGLLRYSLVKSRVFCPLPLFLAFLLSPYRNPARAITFPKLQLHVLPSDNIIIDGQCPFVYVMKEDIQLNKREGRNYHNILIIIAIPHFFLKSVALGYKLLEHPCIMHTNYY